MFHRSRGFARWLEDPRERQLNSAQPGQIGPHLTSLRVGRQLHLEIVCSLRCMPRRQEMLIIQEDE